MKLNMSLVTSGRRSRMKEGIASGCLRYISRQLDVVWKVKHHSLLGSATSGLIGFVIGGGEMLFCGLSWLVVEDKVGGFTV